MPGVSAITDQYWFNDRSATLTEVIKTLEGQAGSYGVRLDRATAVQAATSAMPAGGAGATKSQVAIYLAVSFTRTTHFTPSTGQRSAPDPPGVQGAIQATWELHPDGKPGAEVTWVGQVALGHDPGSPAKDFKVQSLLSGPGRGSRVGAGESDGRGARPRRPRGATGVRRARVGAAVRRPRVPRCRGAP
jgi:hypothetical protein